MTTLTITHKGQITLRKELLRHLHLVPGQRVEVVPQPDGTLSIAPQKPKHDITAIFGMGPKPSGDPLTLEEMDQAVLDAAAENDRRTRT